MSRFALVLWLLSAGLAFADPNEKQPPRTDAFGDPLPDGAVARLGSTRWKGDQFNGLVFSADGKRAAAFGKEPTDNQTVWDVYVWECPSGRLLKRFKGPTWTSVQLAFTPDAKHLVLSEWASVDNTAIANLETGEMKPVTFERPEEAKEGNRVAREGTRSVHCVADGNKRRLALIDALCPDKYQPLGTIEVGTENAMGEVATEIAHRAVAISPDGRWVAACQLGNTPAFHKVRIFDSVSGKSWPGPPLPECDSFKLRFIRDDRLVVVGDDRCYSIWNVISKGQNSAPRLQLVCQYLCDNHPDSLDSSVAFSPSGNLMAGYGNGAPHVVYDTMAGTILWQKTIGTLDNAAAGIHNTTFSPDGKVLAVVGQSESTVRFFDAATGRDLNTAFGHRGAVTSLAFHPTGKLLMSASRADASVRAWDLTPFACRQIAVQEQTFAFGKLAFADSGRLLPLHHSFTEESTALTVLDANKFRVLGSLPIRNNNEDDPGPDNGRMIVSPETSIVAMTHDNGDLDLIDARRGIVLKQYEALAKDCVPLTFSADGKTLIGRTAEYELVSWDLATGRKREATIAHSTSAARRHFAFQQGGTVRICDRVRGQLVHAIEMPTSTFALSGDGRYLVGRSETDGESVSDELVIVETVSGRFVRKIAVPGPRVTALAFSPDSTHIAAGCSDGTILLYPVQPLRVGLIDSIQAADLFTDLEGADAEKAVTAIGTLVSNPREAIEVIRVRLVVLPAKSELNEEQPEAPALLSGKKLQTWRAVEVLERIGSREASDLLKELRQGKDTWLAEWTGDALMRLKPRR